MSGRPYVSLTSRSGDKMKPFIVIGADDQVRVRTAPQASQFVELRVGPCGAFSIGTGSQSALCAVTGNATPQLRPESTALNVGPRPMSATPNRGNATLRAFSENDAGRPIAQKPTTGPHKKKPPIFDIAPPRAGLFLWSELRMEERRL
jgi:hypothetical protein